MNGPSRFVALLRGVNVGGVRMKMADVADVFRSVGLDEVRTVLASGNVLFTTDRTEGSALKRDIEHALAGAYSYDARVIVSSVSALQAAVDAYPFDAEREGWHPYVLFSDDAATLDELAASAHRLDPGDDVIALGDGVLYWQNRRERGIDSDFSKIAMKSRTGATVTNRNLRTLSKILAVATTASG